MKVINTLLLLILVLSSFLACTGSAGGTQESGSSTTSGGGSATSNPVFCIGAKLILKQSSATLCSGTTFEFTPTRNGATVIDVYFSIFNLSSASLTLTGSPKVRISGSGASQFIITQPTQNTMVSQASQQFTIAFNPTSRGLKQALIEIDFSDVTETPFVLNISGKGLGWKAQSSPTGLESTGLSFVDINNGFAVQGNKVIKTANGGQTWVEAYAGIYGTAISFITKDIGYLSGGSQVYKSVNGGSTWSTVYNPGYTSQYFPRSFFTNETTGWVLLQYENPSWPDVYHAIHKLTNNGSSAAQEANLPNASYSSRPSWSQTHISDLFMRGTSKGWAVGASRTSYNSAMYGTVLAYNPPSWTTATVPASLPWLRGVFFITDTKGWAVGDNGTIVTSSDGGASWTTQTSTTTQPLYDVCFISELEGWAVGNNGAVLYTKNGGTNWTSETSPTTNKLSAISCMDNSHAWAAGDGGVILSYTGD